MSAFLVGLTGGIGSGKTTVANLFAAQDIVVVDTDVIAHELTATGGAAIPAICAEFGPTAIDDSGALDRPFIRRHVFANSSARHRLEAILHPMIGRQAMQACAEAASPYVIVAVPLLLEAEGWKERFDRILVIDCDEETQIHRVMARSGLAVHEVRAILAAQINRADRLAAADDILLNIADLSELADKVRELHELYLALARKKLDAQC